MIWGRRPRLLTIVDECAELLQPTGLKSEEGKSEDACKQEIVGLIKSITQLGRSSGMHIIVCPLRLSTIIPTTKGYTTMGEVKVGDIVFDEDNIPAKVVYTSPIKISKRMYEFTVVDSHLANPLRQTFGADGDHRFKVKVRDEVQVINMDRIYALWRQAYRIVFLGGKGWEWFLEETKVVENEPVRCIEVESESHMFLITTVKDEMWQGGKGYVNSGQCLITHNTQRNDASIIPGVIQNNSLALDTELLVMREEKDKD